MAKETKYYQVLHTGVIGYPQGALITTAQLRKNDPQRLLDKRAIVEVSKEVYTQALSQMTSQVTPAMTSGQSGGAVSAPEESKDPLRMGEVIEVDNAGVAADDEAGRTQDPNKTLLEVSLENIPMLAPVDQPHLLVLPPGMDPSTGTLGIIEGSSRPTGGSTRPPKKTPENPDDRGDGTQLPGEGNVNA